MKQLTKKDMALIIRGLENKIDDLKCDLRAFEEDYYHRDTVDEMISEAIDTYERQRTADLRRNEPEYNRSKLIVIEGAA